MHRLESDHPSAAGSLREGLKETITVMRLHLPESLALVLSSTNLIENLFSRVREGAPREALAGRHDYPEMDCGGHADAEHHFRKIAGHRSLSKLVANSGLTILSAIAHTGHFRGGISSC